MTDGTDSTSPVETTTPDATLPDDELDAATGGHSIYPMRDSRSNSTPIILR